MPIFLLNLLALVACGPAGLTSGLNDDSVVDLDSLEIQENCFNKLSPAGSLNSDIYTGVQFVNGICKSEGVDPAIAKRSIKND